MSYIPSQAFNEDQIAAILGQIDENGFIQMELEFQWQFSDTGLKKCGFRIVYEQDIADIGEMISTQSSDSTCITPYEGLDVHHNSTKESHCRDEYEGAGASGEGSSNDVTHS